MRLPRFVIPSLVTAAVLIAVLVTVWRPGEQSTKKPEQCVEALYAAILDGDRSAARSCLATSLHSQLSELMTKKVATYGREGAPERSQDSAIVTYLESSRGASHARRIRFRLQHQSTGWLITDIGSPTDIEQITATGTKVDEHPDP